MVTRSHVRLCILINFWEGKASRQSLHSQPRSVLCSPSKFLLRAFTGIGFSGSVDAFRTFSTFLGFFVDSPSSSFSEAPRTAFCSFSFFASADGGCARGRVRLEAPRPSNFFLEPASGAASALPSKFSVPPTFGASPPSDFFSAPVVGPALLSALEYLPAPVPATALAPLGRIASPSCREGCFTLIASAFGGDPFSARAAEAALLLLGGVDSTSGAPVFCGEDCSVASIAFCGDGWLFGVAGAASGAEAFAGDLGDAEAPAGTKASRSPSDMSSLSCNQATFRALLPCGLSPKRSTYIDCSSATRSSLRLRFP
mmetsp:Transcript_66253/g.184497  ORF Transcript_66253/g.184497 Transcript_66253/m.184497 type:complete len:313 (-) Transcript_66253:581-1519(-)